MVVFLQPAHSCWLYLIVFLKMIEAMHFQECGIYYLVLCYIFKAILSSRFQGFAGVLSGFVVSVTQMKRVLEPIYSKRCFTYIIYLSCCYFIFILSVTTIFDISCLAEADGYSMLVN